MEVQATVCPGKQVKSQQVKSRYNRRTTQLVKADAKEQQPVVHRRVFGIVRNSNIPEKLAPEKPPWRKPSIKPGQTTPPKEKSTNVKKPVPKKPPTEPSLKGTQLTQTTSPVPAVPEKTSPAKKPVPNEATTLPSPKPAEPVQTITPVPVLPEKTGSGGGKSRKKSVSFQEGDVKNSWSTGMGMGMGPQTPAPVKLNRRVSGTPYQTAERCSKCRFDRLETSSYWLSQVKLAEAVGKHFVSAGLFKLALESKAEPIRSLRVELNRYKSRHVYLSDEPDWRDVYASYGFITTDKVGGDESRGVPSS